MTHTPNLNNMTSDEIDAWLQAEDERAHLRIVNAALLEALEALSEAVKPTREGKRDGGTFGRLSVADDIARDAIALAKGEEVTA